MADATVIATESAPFPSVSDVTTTTTIVNDFVVLWVIVTYVVLILGLAAFLLNSCFLYVIIKQRSLRRTPLAVYLVDLSCIDFITATMYLWLAVAKLCTLSKTTEDKQIYLLPFNVFVLCFRNSFQILSSILMICISFERFKAVCRPMKTVTSPTNIPKLAVITAVWTVVLFLVFSIAIFGYLSAIETIEQINVTICNGGSCQLTTSDIYLIDVPVFNYGLIGLDVVTMVTSLAVFWFIIAKLKRMPDLGAASGQIHRDEQRKLTNMALVNNLAFVVLVFLQDVTFCLAVWILSGSPNLNKQGELVYFLQGIWNLLNSSANPIVYNIFGRQFRQGFRDTFNLSRRGSRRSESGRSTGNRPTSIEERGAADTVHDGGK